MKTPTRHSDILTLPMHQLIDKINNKEISSQELLEIQLEHISKHNPSINSVVTIDEELALKKTMEADNALTKGESWGPLHGLPITLKDAYEVKGIPSTGGSSKWKTHIPAKNAVVADRLQQAGAIVFGKTNVPVLSSDWQSYNELFGVTNNPWNLNKTPGGSSGGSAATVAMGFSSLEVGSDLGGSVRIPAHFCGVYGLKPSYGLIPMLGHIPPPPGLLSHQDTISVSGPIARNPKDIQIALSVLAGSIPLEQKGWKLDLPPARHQKIKDFRVAIWPNDPFCTVENAISDAIEEFANQIGKLGASVHEKNPGVSLQINDDIFWNMSTPIIASGFPKSTLEKMKELLRNSDPNDTNFRVRHARAALLKHKSWLSYNEQRLQIKAMWEEFFTSFDVLICPVVFTTAFDHNHEPDMYNRTITVDGVDRRYLELPVWSSVATLPQLPSLAIPIGQNADGLPIGVQVIGPYLEDYTPIAFAQAVEGLCSGYSPPSIVQ